MTMIRVIVCLFTLLPFAALAFSSAPRAFVRNPTAVPFGIQATSSQSVETSDRYSIADQPARFEKYKKEKNTRYLDITSVYDPSYLKGLRVAVTGANQGVGLELAKELKANGAHVVAIVQQSSPELEELKPDELIDGVDVSSDKDTESIQGRIKGGPIDILINNAGYKYKETETVEKLNIKEIKKMFDIDALGPLRIISNVFKAGLLKEGSKIITITSQDASIGWRPTQSPDGHDYGYHMAKCSANMVCMLLAQELKEKGIAVAMFHPGFNKTDMTSEFPEKYDSEGAVEPSIGAKRVLHEAGKVTVENTGKFINCEDGLEIPW